MAFLASLLLCCLPAARAGAQVAPRPEKVSDLARFERPRVYRWSFGGGVAIPMSANDFNNSVDSGFQVGAGIYRDWRGPWSAGMRADRLTFGNKTFAGAERNAEIVSLMAAANGVFSKAGSLRPFISVGLGLNFFKLEQKTSAKTLTGDSRGFVWAVALGLEYELFENTSVGVAVRYRTFYVDDAVFSADRVDAFSDELSLKYRF